jgi:hypothetical protein
LPTAGLPIRRLDDLDDCRPPTVACAFRLGTARALPVSVVTKVEKEKQSPRPFSSAIAIVALVVLSSACASSPHAREVNGDRILAERANGALSLSTLSGDRPQLVVRCYRGVATLLGNASETDAQRAARIVETVPGILRVNNLVLNESASTASGSTRSEKAPMLARAAAGASASADR